MLRDQQGSIDPGLDQRLLFDAGPEALIVVREGVVELANERSRSLLDADPCGAPVRDAIPGWRELWGDAVPYDACLRLPDGSELPIEVRALEVEPGLVVASLRDARALIAGREAEARYRSLVEQIPAVVYADEGDLTTYVNPQIEEILGVTPEAYLSDQDLWLKMVHPDDRDAVEAASEAFIEGRGGDLDDYRMVRPDGRVVWVRDRAYAHRDPEGRLLVEHGILFDVTELKEAEARIAHMAFHDGLTGLANRQLFEETLGLAIERAKRDGTVVGALFLDLDNFKLVNDSMGHHAGDRLLIELAERLKTCTRETDIVARQGGDEFLMLLADLEPSEVTETVRMVSDRVYEALGRPFALADSEFHATGSMGVSLYPQDAPDVETLLKNADIAMYRAKRFEPGGYAFFAADADDAMERLSFATRLRQAVENENWILHYQPVVDLADRRIVGAEALIRWDDVCGGIVPPGEFIPVAEELGLIEAIGDWVVDEVAAQQRAWRDAGLVWEVSFNLSARQLWTPRLAQRLIAKFVAAGVEPGSVLAEITESAAMADPDRTQRTLRDMSASGIRLAIDDFGTGYSSLARLKHMPVDVLKIDQEFVRHVDKDVRLAGMVRAMIQVAQSLDMVPLAEGVETEGEYVFLRSNGCRLAQGFWFAHPMPAEDLTALARTGAPLGSITA